MKFHAFPDRCGFTLIEVIAATVLTGLMLATLTSVLRVQLLEAKRYRNEAKNNPTRQATAVLQHDIANARAYRQTSTQLQLVGYSSRGFNGRSTMRPSLITYDCESSSQGTLLVRKQVDSFGQQQRDNLWLGVGAISVWTPNLDDETVVLDASLAGLVRLSRTTSSPLAPTVRTGASERPSAWQAIPKGTVVRLLMEATSELKEFSVYSSGEL